MLSKEENVICNCALDCGFENRKLEGLFSKIACEGVWDDLDHWIGGGRLR